MATWLGRPRIELEICDSTNDEVARLAAEGAEHGTMVIARAQRRGRGRQGRSWYSPPGENLYLSFLLRPALTPAQVSAITLAVGVAVAETVNSLDATSSNPSPVDARSGGPSRDMDLPPYGFPDSMPAGAPERRIDATLKWPNDVLLGGRKLAGILTEMSTRAHGIEHVIVGIGLNIGSRAFPPELGDRATSLALHGIDVAPGPLIAALVDSLEIWLERFFAGGVPAVADRWLTLAGVRRQHPSSKLDPWPSEDSLATGSHVDRPATPRVRVEVRGLSIEGSIRGLDENGFLLIEDDQGRVHPVIAGDVEPISAEVRHKG